MEIAQPRPASRALTVLLGSPCLSHCFLKDVPQKNPCRINSSSASFPCVPGEESQPLAWVQLSGSVGLPCVYPWLPLVCMYNVLSLTQSRDNQDQSLSVPEASLSTSHSQPYPHLPSAPPHLLPWHSSVCCPGSVWTLPDASGCSRPHICNKPSPQPYLGAAMASLVSFTHYSSC